MTSGVFGVVSRESIDEAYKHGVVKPNEYVFIRDNLINREIFLRYESFSRKINNFLFVLMGCDVCAKFYQQHTQATSLQEAVLYLAYNDPDKLLIEKDDVGILILADVAFNKASKVRDLGDLNKSKLIDGNIFADKETIRSLEYLTKYKRGLWDLLECATEEEKQ